MYIVLVVQPLNAHESVFYILSTKQIYLEILIFSVYISLYIRTHTYVVANYCVLKISVETMKGRLVDNSVFPKLCVYIYIYIYKFENI